MSNSSAHPSAGTFFTTRYLLLSPKQTETKIALGFARSQAHLFPVWDRPGFVADRVDTNCRRLVFVSRHLFSRRPPPSYVPKLHQAITLIRTSFTVSNRILTCQFISPNRINTKHRINPPNSTKPRNLSSDFSLNKSHRHRPLSLQNRMRQRR